MIKWFKSWWFDDSIEYYERKTHEAYANYVVWKGALDRAKYEKARTLD